MDEEETRLDEKQSAPGSLDRSARSEWIGPYRLDRKLGEGGMGEIYLVEQQQPVRRTLALKLIKLGMDTKQVIARFESERQALALMDHRNIARVVDAGATEQGRPYFVMEYVDGVEIDDYCAVHRLSTRQRLELFLDVCDGVQHAHQKGIIHRDIKPSNILVAIHDSEPLPKIIDFGIAKATTEPLTPLTVYTRSGQMIGTPDYMSPEQAGIGDAGVDTRSDVYSLGALLYKLLVGTLPYEVRTGRLDEIRRTIREEEPERPSTRVTHVEQIVPGATYDRVALSRHLRGDLDWITMKALEKEPARRYASVSEMATDIRNHLAHLPVAAGPPSRVYRLKKFVRRHRLGVAAGAVVAVALIAGTAAATFGLVQARRAEGLARQEAARANQEAEAAREISEFLVGLFALNDPSEARGNSLTVREVLDQGALDVTSGLSGRPLLRARLMDAIGRVYQSLGLYAQAGPLLEAAREIRVEQLGAEHPEVAASLDSLGQLLFQTREFEASRKLSERALGIREQALAPDHPDLATSLHNLALLVARMGNSERARTLFERAVAIREQVHGSDSAQLASSLHGLADVSRSDGDHEVSRVIYERVLEIYERARPADHPDVARALESLANLLKETGDYAKARPLYERAIAINMKVFGPDHPQLAFSLHGLAGLMHETGDDERARRMLELALEIRVKGLGDEHELVAATAWDLAGVHRVRGETAAAEGLYRRSLQIRERALGVNHPRVVYDRACFQALIGERRAALALLRSAVALGFVHEWIAEDPDLEALHGNEEFEAIVAEVKRRLERQASAAGRAGSTERD